MLTHGLEKFREYFNGFENQYVLRSKIWCCRFLQKDGNWNCWFEKSKYKNNKRKYSSTL